MWHTTDSSLNIVLSTLQNFWDFTYCWWRHLYVWVKYFDWGKTPIQSKLSTCENKVNYSSLYSTKTYLCYISYKNEMSWYILSCIWILTWYIKYSKLKYYHIMIKKVENETENSFCGLTLWDHVSDMLSVLAVNHNL